MNKTEKPAGKTARQAEREAIKLIKETVAALKAMGYDPNLHEEISSAWGHRFIFSVVVGKGY
jgi:hypothetical protein